MNKPIITSKPVFEGEIFNIEFYITETNEVPAEEFLEKLPLKIQNKFAVLFTRLGNTGKIWNEQKFKHLTNTDQIFEFKVDENRVLCFFFFGKRLILTHGFSKKSPKTPKKEITKAEKYKQDFERRVSNEKK